MIKVKNGIYEASYSEIVLPDEKLCYVSILKNGVLIEYNSVAQQLDKEKIKQDLAKYLESYILVDTKRSEETK